VLDAMYDQRNIRTLAFAAVKSNFVEARRTLFSELLDIVLVREGNSDQPPAAVVQTFEQKYGLRKSARSSDSGCHHDSYCARQRRRPPGYGRKW
jgi:hypothetical protein